MTLSTDLATQGYVYMYIILHMHIIYQDVVYPICRKFESKGVGQSSSADGWCHHVSLPVQ